MKKRFQTFLAAVAAMAFLAGGIACARPYSPGNTSVAPGPAASGSESAEGNSASESGSAEENSQEGTSQEETNLKIEISVSGKVFSAELADSETGRAFAAMLPLTLRMSELNGNEKYHYLEEDLPAAASCPGRIEAGDLMLYGRDCVVLFYESFSTSYSYTRIGRIADAEGLAEALGTGSAEVVFSAVV